MSIEKPPRFPRTPRRPAPSDRPGSSSVLPAVDASEVPNSENLQAWSQLAQARIKLEDGLAEAAGEMAGAVFGDLASSADQEGSALQGSAAAVLGLSLADREEPRAVEWLELAVRAFEQAPEWTSTRRDVAADWALALAGLGRFPAVVELLEWVLTDPREATPLVRRTFAAALASEERTDDAIKVLTETVQVAPADWQAHLWLAQLIEEADPEQPDSERLEAAWTSAGEALLAAGAIDDAVAAAERAVQHGPTAGGLDLAGRSYLASGDYERSTAAFRQSDELEPSAAVRLNLAAVLSLTGAPEEAAQAALEALELRPDDPSLLSAAAAHLLAADQLEGVDLAVEQLAVLDGVAAAGYRGITAYRRGEHSLASTELGAAMYEPPDDPELLWSMAEVLSYLSQTELVIQALDRLLELDPEMAEALAQRGVALVGLGRLAEGEQDLVASLELDSNPGVRAYLGEVMVSADRFDEAVAQLDQALAEGCDEPWAMVAYGQALKGLQRDEEAEQVFRDLVEHEPDDLDAMVGLASILLDKFTPEGDAEAGRVVAHGLELAPESATLLGLRGEVLRRGGELDEAVEHFEHALALISAWPWALGSLAQSLRGRSDATGGPADLHRARELLEDALLSAPNEPFLHSELAEVAARQGRPRKAHEHLKTASRLDPTEVAYLVRRGEFYLDAGEPQRARDCFERALKQRPDQPGLRTQLANLLAEQHELAAAFVLLEQAVTADPNDADAWNARFTLRWNSERWAQSMEDLDHLQTLWPDWGELVARRGDALRLQGRYGDAIELLDGLLADEPGQETGLMVRGAVHLASGRIEEARADLEQAAELVPGDSFGVSQLDELRIASGEADQAIAEIEERLAADPDPALQLRYAGLLQRCARPEEAVTILEDGLWGKLEDPFWLAALGWALVGCARYEEGIGYLGRAAELQPDRMMPLLDVSAAELAVGPTGALAAADKAIEIRSEEPGGWAARSRVQSACGDFDAATESAVRASECWNQMAGTYAQLGWAVHHTTQEGAAERARAAYQRSHELDALDPWTVSGLASTLYSLGLRDESRARYQQCLDLLERRRVPEIHSAATRGWCLFRLGLYDEAWAPALRAVNLTPKPASLLFDLSLIAAARGRGEEARSLVARGAEELQREHPSYQQGTLAVARFDLRQLRAELPPDAVEILDQAHSRLPD